MFHNSLEVEEVQIHSKSLRSVTRKNRNRFQIAQAILEVAKDGAGKTRIMYRANLSYELLENYLTALVRSGLLKVKEAERKMYVTSEKGLQFLTEYEALEKHAELAATKWNELARVLASGEGSP